MLPPDQQIDPDDDVGVISAIPGVSIRCATHTLNLVVEETLEMPCLLNIRDVCQAVTTHFNHSSVSTAALLSLQRAHFALTKKMVWPRN